MKDSICTQGGMMGKVYKVAIISAGMISNAAYIPAFKVLDMSIAGTDARMHIPSMKIHSNFCKYQSVTRPELNDTVKHNEIKFGGHWNLMEHMLRVIKGEEELLIKPEEVIDISAVIEAFYMSSKLSREVIFDEVAKK